MVDDRKTKRALLVAAGFCLFAATVFFCVHLNRTGQALPGAALPADKDAGQNNISAGGQQAADEQHPLRGKFDGVQSEPEKKRLAARGVLKNTDRPLAALRKDPSVLMMRNAIIDTRVLKEEGKGIEVPGAFAAAADTRRFIVMLQDAVSDETKAALRVAGASVEGYLPNRAVAVTADADVMERIRSMSSVVHVEPYHPYFKMSAAVQAYLTGSADEAVRESVEKGEYELMLFSGGDAGSALEEMGVSFERGKIGEYELASVKCEPSRLSELVKIDGVRWVEEKVVPQFMNDLANTTLRARPLKMAVPGLDGSGVIVGIADSGIDFTHPTFSQDPSLPTSTNTNTRIVGYLAVPGGSLSDGVPGDVNGHGTHVAGSIIGNGAASDTVIKAPGSGVTGVGPYSSNEFAGIAYNAKLFVMEDFNSIDHTQLCSVAYANGARLSNNSWGAAGLTDYSIMSMTWDFLVADANNDPVDGLQAYTCFFAAGNSAGGPNYGRHGFPSSIGSPGNAKNVITVGAVEQRRRANNLLPYSSDEQTDSDWEITSFSSRGPTSDGRFKPDVVAPGAYVLSAQSKDSYPDPDYMQIPEGVVRDWHHQNLDTGPKYAVMSGTSMATPLTTGCGALFYQYYTNAYGVAPSPALMKAALINGAAPTDSLLYEQRPGDQLVFEGWGMVDIYKTIMGPRTYPSAQVIFHEEADIIFTTNDIVGANGDFDVVIDNENEGGLKITLAWTDYPGTPGAGAYLVNDLDLVVKGPDGTAEGTVYIGNLMRRAPWGNVSLDVTDSRNYPNNDEGVWSRIWDYDDADQWGLCDRINNVEQVIVRHARKGTYRIEVHPHQIPHPGQKFALVVHRGAWSLGDSQGSAPSVTLDTNGNPVVVTADWFTNSVVTTADGEDPGSLDGPAGGPNVVGLRRWKGSFGETTELNTWKVLKDKWFDSVQASFDYSRGPDDQEWISGYVEAGGEVRGVYEPDLAVATNGRVYCVWGHECFSSNEPNVIFLRYTDGTNLYQLGPSYDTSNGVCGAWINDDAFAPNVEIGPDGNPIVAYVQKHLDIAARTFNQEVIVRRWNGTSWVSYDGSPSGMVRQASFASSLDMVMDGGVPVLLWFDLRDKVLRCYKWSSNAWRQQGPDFGTKPVLTSRPRLTVSGGVPYAAWAEYGVNSTAPAQTIRVARLSGSSWVGLGSPTNSLVYPGVSITNHTAWNPQIASLGNRVYVAWQNGSTNFNTINLKVWDGTRWSGLAGSDSNTIVKADAAVTLRSMAIHPLGLPVIAYETQYNKEGEPGTTNNWEYRRYDDEAAPPYQSFSREDCQGGTIVGRTYVTIYAGDVAPPAFNGIDFANGTLSNSVNTGWTQVLSAGGQTMTYTVYRSPGSWDPADPAIPASDDAATIAAVFGNAVGSITNAGALTFNGLQENRVWYWGVRVRNATGLSDSNTRIILGGPFSATGDADNDWLTYIEEFNLGTSPVNRDTDGDGMWDGWEWFYSTYNTGQVVDVDAHTNGLAMDPFDNGSDDVRTATPNDGSAGQDPYDDLDDDGLFNIEEFLWWYSNNLAGGISSRTNEVNWLLDPTNPDSDGDGMPDGWEVFNNLNPGDTNNYGTVLPLTTGVGPGDDPDGDGVNNLNEYLIGGDPWNPDSDQDGLTDGQELTYGTRGDDPDTDDDGLQDGFEIVPGVNGNPRDADSNNNGCSDGNEYELGWTDVGAPRVLTTDLLWEDFETGAGAGWTTFSPNVDLWHITSGDPNPPPTNVVLSSSHTTNYSYRCANEPPPYNTTNGTYEVPGQLIYSALDTPILNASAAGTINLFVDWKEWYITESQWDLCQVLVSGDGGLNWTLARTSVSGISSGWVSRVADISSQAASATVRVRFLFRTLNTINNAFPGWYVDDVRVWGGNAVTGTVRNIDGKPIKNATVYAIGSGGLTNTVFEHSYVNPGTIFSQATTDNAGRYQIRGLYRGNYYVKGTYPGYKAEFWNGDLYNTALPFYTQFGGQINPGVTEKWRVTNPASLAAFNTASQCDFELESGTSRGSLAVLSATNGLAVYLSQQSTNAMIWNGSTNAPVMNAYVTAGSVTPTRPDWYTNNLELTGTVPVMLEDVSEGDHTVFFSPSVWSNLPWISRVKATVRDGESTLVTVRTNFVSGEIHVVAENATNNIIIDRRDTGRKTTGTDVPVVITVAAGEHEVTLRPSGSNDWIAPKIVTATPTDRARAVWTSNEMYAARGDINVKTINLKGLSVSGASVWLDGYPIAAGNTRESTNITPLTIAGVRAGDHFLTVYKDGYKYSPLRAVSAYSNMTNFVTITLYEADRDYDETGDAFEQVGYTNLFLYAGQDDPDSDGLLNQAEYDLFRIDGMLINLGDPDSDDDMVMDGVEVGYDGVSNRLALSVLYTNAAVSGSNVWVYFHGRFLEGVNAFNTNMLGTTNGMRLSLEGDLCAATNMVWISDQLGTPVMQFDVPRFGASNRVVSVAHNFNTPAFADMIPDEVDTDGDIMYDGFEYIFEGVGNLMPIEIGGTASDADNDGLNNLEEFLGYDGVANTNDWTYPNNPDTDGDGIPDGWEMQHNLDPRNPNDALLDVDNDGLTAVEEWQNLTDPQNPDSDSDGLSDGLEVNRYGSLPLVPDTDNDGLLDGEEVADTDLNPNNGIDGGFFPDWNGGDMDYDGNVDGPTDWDTDGDGMPDGFEVKDAWGNVRTGGLLDPSDPTDGALDSDGDGLSNLQEYLVRDQLTGNHPSTFDPTWGIALWDYVTDPFNADTDGDGMPDGFEVFNGLHPIDPIPVGVSGNTNEYLRYTPLWRYGDLDLDGVANTNEYGVRFILDPNADSNQLQGSTHPWLDDTDADGLEDGQEFKSFTANPLSQDTDGDGLVDGSGVLNTSGEVDTSVIVGDTHYDQAFNDMWGLVAGTLPYPQWGANYMAYDPLGAPTPRWGGELVHVQYEASDDETGNYVCRPVGEFKVPARQSLLVNNTYVLLGGRDGIDSINDVWEFYPVYGTWANRGTFPILMGTEGWSEMSAAVRTRSVDYKHVTAGLAGRMTRPRPGGPPGYEFYTDDTNIDPLEFEIWGPEGVANWDWNVFVCGWVKTPDIGPGDYYYAVDGMTAGLLPGISGTVGDASPPDSFFYTANWKTRDETNIVVRYGWKYLADAYDWQRFTAGLAYNQLDDEAAGETGPYIKAGADPTNTLYAGMTFGPVMNTQTDYSGGAVPTVVSARIRLQYAAAANVTINYVSELGRLSLPTLPNTASHNTLSAPETYYTGVGQNPAYRPRNRDVNLPKFPPNPWAFNSATIGSVVFQASGISVLTTNIDVTTQFTQAMAANNNGVWEIGNNLGFLFFGSTNTPGFVYFEKASGELFVDVTTPPYLQDGQWYVTAPPGVPADKAA